ncbi:hypothetical protein RHECIAT_CH0000616 [Rhizobium etli CIAT 652]|uniref:Uncharacterized protein n=1 Tax=Rhizobium etli (strain CIAT 652) TaxID=491916 RepID=B3PNP4_RHIE6|nr:hypothetical protein RHECIAT_CH0000616 [Rhizobium etli CIAT 652]
MNYVRFGKACETPHAGRIRQGRFRRRNREGRPRSAQQCRPLGHRARCRCRTGYDRSQLTGYPTDPRFSGRLLGLPSPLRQQQPFIRLTQPLPGASCVPVQTKVPAGQMMGLSSPRHNRSRGPISRCSCSRNHPTLRHPRA